MSSLMIRVLNVSKEYKLGQIGGTTLRDELQRWAAQLLGKEDPTKVIGSKDYNRGDTFLALDAVSFDVDKKERIGIIGHNGAGKSTLLKLLSRVTAPSDGAIGLNGRIASMLEVGTGFHGELTGRENIYMNGAILGMTKKEIDAKIEDIIDFSECRQFIDTPVKRYSSGMYVKLAFSVAAHLDSEIMIMDEVLAVGDAKFQQKCLTKMRDVSEQEDRTVLYVSHNMKTIRQLCTRCIVLDHGKIIYDGDVERAIEIYSGIIPISPKRIDFSSVLRTKTCLDGIKIQSIELTSHPEWRIPVGDRIHINVKVNAVRNLDRVGFRTRLSCYDNTSVSVLSANNILNCSAADETVISLEGDISQLMPGRYCLTPTLYQINEFGETLYYDHIAQGIIFEVVETEGFNQNVLWNRTFWGDVRLPDYKIINK